MKYVRLTNSIIKACVDDEDFNRVNQYKWYLNSHGYAVHSFTHGEHVKMHHFIVGRPLKPLVTDHINRWKWDNRRSNLRFVTVTQNNQNRPGLGVTWNKSVQKWQVQRERNKKVFYLGLFRDKAEAETVSQTWEAAQ